MALSAYSANISSGNRAASSKSQRVKNGDSLELQAESENLTVTSSLIAEGYPISEMTVAQAEAYKNPPLTKTFELWTFFENISVFSQIMPVIKTNNLHHEVEMITQKVGLTRHAPERTRAHTLQQRRSRYSIHLNRYNIGVELLSQSLETDEGKNLYVRDLQAMRVSYLESNAIRTIIELQTCQTPWRDPTKRYGNARALTSDTLKNAIEYEKSFFGLVQREAGFFELLDTLINKAQEPIQGAEGDTYIMPKSLLNFNTQVLDESKYYMFGGPEAVTRFKNGPNGIHQDGRGNAIVTFRCYEMDGEPPLKPLLEFVDIMTYFSTRDTRLNERYDETFESSQRTVMIFDIDRDQWVPISTKYVLENCHRFDPVTGAPYGLDHDLVNRHEVDYTNTQFNDSYHYKVQNGPSVYLKQCVFMGQIDKKHITVDQIKQKMGQYTTLLMKELHKLGTAAQTKKAIDEGLDLLRQIEDLGGADAEKYIRQAIPAGNAVAGINAHSDFGPSFAESFMPQNSDSGFDLPTNADALAAAAALRAPAGFGSYAGFKAIEKAYIAANRVDADFTAATGLPSDVARRAVNFLTVFNEYANQASSFFAGSLGVDPRQSSPWWKRGTTAHVIWDAVLTPQHRLPILTAAGAATPLLYTPRLLGAVTAAPGFGFANPANTKEPLDLAADRSVAALKRYVADGNPDHLANLDPALIPMASTNESPAVANSILSNYNRSQFIASQRPGAQVGGAATVPMQGVIASTGLGKRSASAMTTAGRTLSAFGGAAAALNAVPQKQARTARTTTVYGNADIKEELSTDNFIELWDEIDADTSLDPISKMNCKLYLLSPLNLKVLLNWDARNMAVFIGSIGFRCITLGTQSIIKVKSGQCGNQYYSRPSYRWNIDGILGVFRGQLDYWFAAKVTDPRKVFHADNVYIEQYLGGGGSAPVSDANVTPVSDATSMRTERPSVYLSLEPYNRGNYSDIVSITGRMRDVGIRMGITVQDNDVLDFDNAPYFNRVYGHQEQIVSAREGSVTFWPGSSPVMAYREVHKVWDRERKDYTKTIGGTGLIPDAWIGPGLKKTLNGALTKPPAYTHDYLVK